MKYLFSLIAVLALVVSVQAQDCPNGQCKVAKVTVAVAKKDDSRSVQVLVQAPRVQRQFQPVRNLFRRRR